MMVGVRGSGAVGFSRRLLGELAERGPSRRVVVAEPCDVRWPFADCMTDIALADAPLYLFADMACTLARMCESGAIDAAILALDEGEISCGADALSCATEAWKMSDIRMDCDGACRDDGLSHVTLDGRDVIAACDVVVAEFPAVTGRGEW